jgi:succinate-semialdehyde dehydrogenase / glutarate-semialdehyde dehydrogenase
MPPPKVQRSSLEATLTSNWGPNFYVPTILTDTTTEMLFFKEETFGPVAPLTPFDTEEEAIQIANNTNAGPAAYFYTEDISRLWRVSEALEVGMVECRVGLVSACEQLFGGTKESGIWTRRFTVLRLTNMSISRVSM